jgi:hypothetical protein
VFVLETCLLFCNKTEIAATWWRNTKVMNELQKQFCYSPCTIFVILMLQSMASLFCHNICSFLLFLFFKWSGQFIVISVSSYCTKVFSVWTSWISCSFILVIHSCWFLPQSFTSSGHIESWFNFLSLKSCSRIFLINLWQVNPEFNRDLNFIKIFFLHYIFIIILIITRWDFRFSLRWVWRQLSSAMLHYVVW